MTFVVLVISFLLFLKSSITELDVNNPLALEGTLLVPRKRIFTSQI